MSTPSAALALGLALISVPAGAQISTAPARVTASLAGTIVGVPGGRDGLPGIRVTLAVASVPVYETTTDADGAFFFREIRAGAYTVAVRRADYTIELGQVQLVAGQSLLRTYTKGAVVTGRVVDERGVAVQAIPVCLLRPADDGGPTRYEPIASGVTDARGRFVIGLTSRLDRGRYGRKIKSSRFSFDQAR
jgi:hypothetical protein